MGTMINRRREMGENNSPFIRFADPAVKAICVNNWGDATGGATGVVGVAGEMTYEQAAAVTNAMLGQTFRNNASIVSFREFRNFTSITSIDNYAFRNCANLESIVFPTSLTSIGWLAFQNCGLRTISFHDGIKNITGQAFYECSLLSGSLFIPASVTTCDNFESCLFDSIEVASGNTIYDSRNNCNAIIITASNTLLRGCNATMIPNNVVALGNSSFRLTGFTSIDIPSSVTSIGSHAFSGVSTLTSVSLPQSLSTIGQQAFRNTSIISIDIPSSVTSIGQYAFSSQSLRTVIVRAVNPPTLGSAVFISSVLTALYVPDASVEDYKAAKGWSTYASKIKSLSELP